MYKRQAKAAKDKTVDESEKIAEELQKLREAEAKAKEEQRIAKEKEAELERARKRKRISEEDKLRQEYMQEASEEIDELDGISDQEMNWNGLESGGDL